MPVPCPEFDPVPLSDRLPLDRRVEPPGQCLQDLATGDTEQEGLVGRGEVVAIAALEPDENAVIFIVVGVHTLDGPLGVLRGSFPVLRDGLLVLIGEEVFVVVAPEADRLGPVEEVHSRAVLVGAVVRELCRKRSRTSKRMRTRYEQKPMLIHICVIRQCV